MRVLSVLVPVLLLTACGGGSSGGSSSTSPVAPVVPVVPVLENFTLVDPSEAAGNKFGVDAIELTNGNIAVRSLDSSLGSNFGAVHIYNPLTKSLIKSLYGDHYEELEGLTLTALANGNLVVVYSNDSVNAVSAGSVKLFNGVTGAQIGSTISGDNAYDSFGSTGITELSNGNYVIASEQDKVSGKSNAGSITLVNGTTGVQIGSPIVGATADDRLAGTDIFIGISGSVTALNNGNYVIASPHVNSTNNGSIVLVSGVTGLQIGLPIVGNNQNDWMGSSGVAALGNGNYVIGSHLDDVGGVVDAGSVTLMNGTTGVQIGSTISGSTTTDLLANNGIVALANNEFIVSSTRENVGPNLDAGTAKIFNGTTGNQIGATYAGSYASDYFGGGAEYNGGGSTKIIQLTNNNIVITSPLHDGPSGSTSSNSGKITLINGTTKAVISTFATNQKNGELGATAVKGLNNGNYVVVSELQDDNLTVNVGSVMVFNGTTGAQIGSTVYGDVTGDSLGSSAVTVLGNSNFVIGSLLDDVNGVSNAGSAMLFSGETGALIGSPIVGLNADDNLSSNGIVALTGSNNYVISSSKVDVNGVTNVGSVTLVNGVTGVKIGDAEAGNDHMDQLGSTGITVLNSGNYLIKSELNDDNGNTDTGSVLYRLGQ